MRASVSEQEQPHPPWWSNLPWDGNGWSTIWGPAGEVAPPTPDSPRATLGGFSCICSQTKHRRPSLLPAGTLPCPAVYGGISQPCLGTCLRLHYSYLLLGLGSPSQAEAVLYVPGLGVSSPSPVVLQSVSKPCRMGDTGPANGILM